MQTFFMPVITEGQMRMKLYKIFNHGHVKGELINFPDNPSQQFFKIKQNRADITLDDYDLFMYGKGLLTSKNNSVIKKFDIGAKV